MDQETAVATPEKKTGIGNYKKVFEAASNLNDTKKSLGCGVCLLFSVVRSIAMLVVGALYLRSCHVKPMIPAYLLGAGAMGLLGEALLAFTRYRQHTEHETPAVLKILNGVLPFVQAIWFIIGCVVVYGLPAEHRHAPHCSRFVYLFAFWMITLSFIIMALTLVLFCCLPLCVVCWGILTGSYDKAKEGTEQPSPAQPEVTLA